MKPANSQLRNIGSRTDAIVAGITAVVLIVSTALLVILLF